MKKENRRKAQELRAKARKQKEQRSKLKFILSITLLVILLVGSTVLMIVDPFSSEPTLSFDKSLTVKKGDTIYIDFVGSIDGVEFEGGNTQGMGVDLTIGSNSMIDDFEDQLIGSHPGDSVDVNVTFPDDYHMEEFQGQDALFKVKVHGIYK